jgi:hypothetical protein
VAWQSERPRVAPFTRSHKRVSSVLYAWRLLAAGPEEHLHVTVQVQCPFALLFGSQEPTQGRASHSPGNAVRSGRGDHGVCRGGANPGDQALAHRGKALRRLAGGPYCCRHCLARRVGVLEWHLGEMMRLVDELTRGS